MFEYFYSYFVHTFFSYNSCFTISLSFQLFLASSYQPVITLYLTTSPFSLSTPINVGSLFSIYLSTFVFQPFSSPFLFFSFYFSLSLPLPLFPFFSSLFFSESFYISLKLSLSSISLFESVTLMSFFLPYHFPFKDFVAGPSLMPQPCPSPPSVSSLSDPF